MTWQSLRMPTMTASISQLCTTVMRSFALQVCSETFRDSISNKLAALLYVQHSLTCTTSTEKPAQPMERAKRPEEKEIPGNFKRRSKQHHTRYVITWIFWMQPMPYLMGEVGTLLPPALGMCFQQRMQDD